MQVFFFEQLHVSFSKHQQVVSGQIKRVALAGLIVKANQAHYLERQVTLQEVDRQELAVDDSSFTLDKSELLDGFTLFRKWLNRPSHVQRNVNRANFIKKREVFTDLHTKLVLNLDDVFVRERVLELEEVFAGHGVIGLLVVDLQRLEVALANLEAHFDKVSQFVKRLNLDALHLLLQVVDFLL